MQEQDDEFDEEGLDPDAEENDELISGDEGFRIENQTPVNNKGVSTKINGLSNITNSTASPIIRPNSKSVNQRYSASPTIPSNLKSLQKTKKTGNF